MNDPKIFIIAEHLASLSAREIVSLCRYMQDEYDIHMQLSLNQNPNPQPYLGQDDVTPPPEQMYSVIITHYQDGKKIAVIRIIRSVMHVGLAQAKTISESLPCKIMENCNSVEAQRLYNEIVFAGGFAVIERS